MAAGLELLRIALEQPDDSFQEVDVFLSPFFYYLLQAGGSQALCAGLSTLLGCHKAIAEGQEMSRGGIRLSEAACQN